MRKGGHEAPLAAHEAQPRRHPRRHKISSLLAFHTAAERTSRPLAATLQRNRGVAAARHPPVSAPGARTTRTHARGRKQMAASSLAAVLALWCVSCPAPPPLSRHSPVAGVVCRECHGHVHPLHCARLHDAFLQHDVRRGWLLGGERARRRERRAQQGGGREAARRHHRQRRTRAQTHRQARCAAQVWRA